MRARALLSCGAALATAVLALPVHAAQAATSTTTVLHVGVSRAAITGIPQRMPAGQYTFRAEQAAGAELQLARLRDGYTPTEFAHDHDSGNDARLDAQAVFEGGTTSGPRAQLTAFLAPGTYVYADLGPDPLGQVQTVVVTEAGRTAPDPPRVDATVVAYEDPARPHHYGWDVKGAVARAGSMRFKAAGTDQPQTLSVFTLDGSTSPELCLDFDGPPWQAPCSELFTTGQLSPGQAMVLPYALPRAGRYFLASSTYDDSTGTQVARLGAVRVFTVR